MLYLLKLQTFWTTLAVAFEKKNGEKVPKCIIYLLTKSGHNSVYTLKNLDDNKVDIIESFLDQNKQFVNKLEGRHSQTYKSMKKFKFLPPHRNLILSIPEILPEIEAAMQRAKQRAKPKTNICLKKKNKKLETKSDDVLKQELLNCLKKVAKKFEFERFNDVLSDANIVDFRKVDGKCECGQGCKKGYKCCFICPVCPKKYVLQYNEYWMSSNATKHIKKHIQDQVEAQTASNHIST